MIQQDLKWNMLQDSGKENQKFKNPLRRIGEHISFEGRWNYRGRADGGWRFAVAKVKRERWWDIFIYYSHDNCSVLSRKGRGRTFTRPRNISWRYLIVLRLRKGKNDGCAQYNGCESDRPGFKSLICQFLDITPKKVASLRLHSRNPQIGKRHIFFTEWLWCF